MTEPSVDFDQGTLLTHNVVEAMRRTVCGKSSTPRAAASTATWANTRRTRTMGRLIPVSTYGASKLAGEALISSYATCSI